MTALADHDVACSAADLARLVITPLEDGYTRTAEGILAGLALWVLDGLQARRLSPETADQTFTLLDRYLTDHSDLPALSEEAQEIVFEGEHLHHFGQAFGPDVEEFRRLAASILQRLETQVHEP